MNKEEEPDWRRKADREALKWSWGIWLACLTHALILVLVSRFNYTLAMTIWQALALLILMGCSFFWRRSRYRPVLRPFILTLGILSFLGGLLSLVPTGVTDWG
ncbi:hypothetical protein [Parasphingorhabdus sp.]|uniref:hypothetical protein n=1 Tax=Parasphingorhabdus sp. TaxID=2709688 RepID=UPI00359383CC